MADKKQSVPPLAILRRRQVEQRVGLKRSTIYQQIAAGTFPAPISLGSRSVGWLSHEIERWLSDRVAAREAAK